MVDDGALPLLLLPVGEFVRRAAPEAGTIPLRLALGRRAGQPLSRLSQVDDLAHAPILH